MPKCKNCGHNLTLYDKDVCPFCGEKNPIEPGKDNTADITKFVDNADDFSSDKIYKRKKKKIYVILMATLGIFSCHLFYIKRYSQASFLLLCNMLFIGGAGYLLSLCFKFPVDNMYFLYWIISLGIVVIFYIVLSLITLFKGVVTDNDGQILR